MRVCACVDDDDGASATGVRGCDAESMDDRSDNRIDDRSTARAPVRDDRARHARAMTSTTHARDAQPAVRRAYAVAHGWEHAAALSVAQNASIAQLTSAVSSAKRAPEVRFATRARARAARCVMRDARDRRARSRARWAR